MPLSLPDSSTCKCVLLPLLSLRRAEPSAARCDNTFIYHAPPPGLCEAAPQPAEGPPRRAAQPCAAPRAHAEGAWGRAAKVAP